MYQGERIYTAEVFVPALVWGSQRERTPLPRPEAFGIIRGYWSVAFRVDNLGHDEPVGLTVVFELLAVDRETAEDLCLAVAKKLGTFFGFHFGSPYIAPHLERIAKLGPNGRLVEQSVYSYGNSDRLAKVEVEPQFVTKLLDQMAQLEDSDRSRVERAQRWYRQSISFADPLDGYLAAWIGLESIVPVLGKRVHPDGPNSACDVCDAIRRPGRKNAQAAFEHVAVQVCPEILKSSEWKSLEALRHDTAHSRKPDEALRKTCRPVLQNLQLVLSTMILSGIARSGPERRTLGVWPAYLPRVRTEYPDLRFWVTFQSETMRVPFMDEWVKHSWKWSREYSATEENGQYLWGTGLQSNWTTKSTGEEISDEGCERYSRFGMGFVDRPDVFVGEGQRDLKETGWHGDILSPCWARLMGQSPKSSEDSGLSNSKQT